MIDLNKKYTSNGDEVIALFHYPENKRNSRLIAHVKTGEQIECQRFYENGDFTEFCVLENKKRKLKPAPEYRYYNIYIGSNGRPYAGDVPYDSEDSAVLSVADINRKHYHSTIKVKVND